MLFRQFVDEDLGCASYLVGDADAGEALLIDPAYAIEPYLDGGRAGGRPHRARAGDAHARRPRLRVTDGWRWSTTSRSRSIATQ